MALQCGGEGEERSEEMGRGGWRWWVTAVGRVVVTAGGINDHYVHRDTKTPASFDGPPSPNCGHLRPQAQDLPEPPLFYVFSLFLFPLALAFHHFHPSLATPPLHLTTGT